MTVSEKLLKYNERRAEVQKQLDAARVLVKDAFNEGAQEILKEQGIETFSWVQYTPYFNDGDECVFGVRSDTDAIEINGVRSDDDEGNPYPSGSRYTDAAYTKWRDTIDQKYGPIADFLSQFDDTDLLFLFGDHVKVIVSTEGTETEHWDHD